MKKKTRSIVFMAVLMGLMLLFGFTPVGYIPLPFAVITIMCLPVIIGTLVLGLKMGMGLSLVFILTSIAQLFMAPDALSQVALSENPAGYILCLVIPRLLIPVAAWATARALNGKMPRGGLFVASAVGSLVNTFGYLLMVRALVFNALQAAYTLNAAGANALIWGVALTNGLPEAVIALIVCPFVVMALRKSIPSLDRPKERAAV